MIRTALTFKTTSNNTTGVQINDGPKSETLIFWGP